MLFLFPATLIPLLQIIFIILRLCNVITWNWYIVFIPAYIEIGIAILIYLIAFIVGLGNNRD